MTSVLEKIEFGDESGDVVEPQELASYFVEKEVFAKFLDPRNKIRLATAKKGVGKSALLQWLAYRLGEDDKDALIIKCRGADLTRGQFGLSAPLTTPNEHIRDWMVRLCTLVNRRLAQRINLALSDDKIALVESAEIDGYKSRNLVGCLLDRLSKMIPGGAPTKLGAIDQKELLKRQRVDSTVWILIDDLDATFQNTENELVELSSFFSAARYLSADLVGLRFRVTMRTDVWPIIRRYDESLDKVEQYVTAITWTEDDFRQLLSRRIASQLQSKPGRMFAHEQDAELYQIAQVFVPKMQWGSSADKRDGDGMAESDSVEPREVHSHRVIYTLSYGRPRWAIQLCKSAQRDAVRHHDDRIGKGNIDNVWGEYGAKRIDDLVAEHKHQCKTVSELVNAFRGASRLMQRDELMKWINTHVMPHLKPTIDGRAVSSPIEVAHFLYRIGFLQARSDEGTGSYEHYNFDQMADFLTSRTNDDFGVRWEIHPCYRQALDIKKINRAQRIKKGLIRPTKPRR